MAIKVSGTVVIDNDRNISNVGIITATSFSGDGSNLTNIPKQGGSFSSVASGNIPDGSPVCINIDGTVSAITGIGTTISVGNAALIDTSAELNSRKTTTVYDPSSGKSLTSYHTEKFFSNPYIVVAGFDNLDGNKLTFGVPERIDPTFTSSTEQGRFIISLDSTNNKLVVGYPGGINNYKAFVVTLSSSDYSISRGTTVDITNNFAFGYESCDCVYDSNSSKHVFVHRDGLGGTILLATLFDVSGTSINVGITSEVVSNVPSFTAYDINAIFDSNANKIVITYVEPTNYYSAAIVGTVSGSNITFGTPVIYSSIEQGEECAMTFDSNTNKVFIAYTTKVSFQDGLSAIVGQVSGNSINFGTPIEVEPNANGRIYVSTSFDPTTNKVILMNSRSNGWIRSGTITSGGTNTVSFGSTTKFSDVVTTRAHSSAYDTTNNKVISTYILQQGSPIANLVGKAFEIDALDSNLSDRTVVGFSNGPYNDGQTASIKIVSNIAENQIGLSTGNKYYVQRDGSLATTVDLPEILAGTSISSNKLLIGQ